MESGGVASGGGAGGDGGHLCRVCGYKYASAHPSAKQRRAHRKSCGGKPLPSAATPAAVEEDEVGSGLSDGRKLLLGEGEGERGGGEGSGAGASDCGGAFSGSAQDVGNAVADECNAEQSSPNGAGVHAIINGSIEEIPSEVIPKANESKTQTESATKLSESAPYHQDSHTSQPAISFEQHPDASASHRSLEPEDDASFSPELSANEINKLSDTSLAPNAAAADIPAQTNTIVGSPPDVAVTNTDCMTTTIHKDQTSDEVKGSAINLYYQEKLETEIAGGQNATAMEADPSVHNLSKVYKEEIPSEDTEPKEQNTVILTGSIEQVIKEPANLIGNEESCTENHVCAYETNGDDLFELGSSDSQLEIVDAVKPQQETDYSSLAAEHPIVQQEGQPCPDPDEIIRAVPSPTGPSVVAEVIPVGSATNLTKNDCSSEMTIGDIIQHNVSPTDAITCIPPEVDSTELSSYPSPHEIDTVVSEDLVLESRKNQNISADLTFHGMNGVDDIDVEKKQWKEDISAYTSSLEINVACSTCDFGEQRKNEGIIGEHGANDFEEVIAMPASEKNHVMSSGDTGGEKESELHVETTYETDVPCSIEHVEGKKETEEITTVPTCEISAVNNPSNIELKRNEETTEHPISCVTNVGRVTDNVEGQKQNEESTRDCSPRSINVIPSPDEDKTQTEEMITPSPFLHDVVMVHDTGNVTEKNEDTMSGPTSFKIDALSTTGSVQEKKQTEEITVGPTSHGIDVLPIVGAVEEKKNEEHTSDPVSGKINVEGNTDGVEGKWSNGEITMGSSSHENNTPQGTDNAGEMKQDKEAATDSASETFIPAQSTDDTEENKLKEETATSEIDNTHSIKDDQEGEITDKEMTINSDKNHVSLKALLSEKGMETKEKKASSTKERVLSFRRKSSKESVSPGKPGSGQQDWNSPARLPVEKSPKGKKQQWMPFICCPSIK